MTGYGLLGATWLVMKSTGELELWARRKALAFLIATIIAMGIVSAWVPFLGRQIEERWFAWPNILILSPVPLLPPTRLGAFTGPWRTGGTTARSFSRSGCSCSASSASW